jgi:hypothetical protein
LAKPKLRSRPRRPLRDDGNECVEAVGERRRPRLQDERGFDLAQEAVAHRGNGGKSEKATTRSGSSAKIFSKSAEMKAETRGFSWRTRAGRTA